MLRLTCALLQDFVKQDLPWAEQLDTVTLSSQLVAAALAAAPLGVFGQKAAFTQLTAGQKPEVCSSGD